MPAYTVLTPLRHSGTTYQPGDTIELGAKEAAPLLDAELIMQDPAARRSPTKAPKSAE